MKNYIAQISWMTFEKNYSYKSKTIRNIQANNIIEASEIALKTIEGKMQAAINSIWYNP